MPAALYQLVLFSNLEDKAGKSGDLTGARCPVMLPVIVEIGGSMAVALNALAFILVTRGGGTPLRSRLVDSLDDLSVIDSCQLSSPGSCCGSSCDFDELVFVLDC